MSKGKRRLSGKWELERNHTHYLMLDDGTSRYFDIQDYRTQLAIHIARLKNEDDIASKDHLYKKV